MRTLTLEEYSNGKTKPWSMENEIKARVDKESEVIVDDSFRYQIPKFEKIIVDKNWSAGWYNFIKGLRP